MREWRAVGAVVPEEEIQRLLGRIETKVQMLLDSRIEDAKKMATVEERISKLEKWQTRTVAWCAGAVAALAGVLGVILNVYRAVK